MEIEHDFAHEKTASNELLTAGFTLVNASLDWHPFEDPPDLTLSLSGRLPVRPGGASLDQLA
jgi:hypothetical protein